MTPAASPTRRWLRLVSAVLLTLVPATAATADWVSVLDDNASAVEARVKIVLAAEEEILVSSFIVGDEPFSLTALALLRSAVRRGIQVRLLVDAQWNKMPQAIEAHLLAEGVAVRRFHPFRLCHPLWVTKRLHDKLVIVDGDRLILGGRNVESPYFGLGRQLERRDYVDLDLLIQGEAASTARAYYLEVWDSRHTAPSRARASTEELRAAEVELDRHSAWLEQRIEGLGGLESTATETTSTERAAIWVKRADFLHDPARGKGSGPGVGGELLRLLQEAQESVIVESPYLIPTRKLRRALAGVLGRGVRVQILTNSLTTTDNLWAQAGYVGMRKRLVRMGVELWEYEGPESIHTKAGVLDRQTTIVGSFNLDPRSANLNTEVVVVLKAIPLALEVGTLLDSHLERAHRIDTRGWPEGSDEPFPGVPGSKIRRLRLLRLLAPFIRGQL
jgi:phosphatidylserine/phosphatidylglycerophosphate/cardiolipin synthase-like enzyme